jgi:endonuclease YncB( thermonuclease family)
MLAALLAAVVYHGTVIHAVDGDTLRISVPRWPAPFTPIDVRVYGIDAPEHVAPPAQSACEVVLGLKASLFAHTLVKPGDKVSITWSPAHPHDKYGRLLGAVTLADGRDWAATMISGGFARPYGADGNLHKAPWCSDAPPAAEDPPH